MMTQKHHSGSDKQRRKIESYAMSWFSWDTFALCYVKKETKRNKISSQPNSNCCMFIVQMCVIKSIHKIHRTLKISCTKSGLHFVSCCKKAYYSSKDAYSQSHYIEVMQGVLNWLWILWIFLAQNFSFNSEKIIK